MVNNKQLEMIENLHSVLLKINEEAINDDEFNNWLNRNYFFDKDLEEVINKVKKAIEK